MAAATGDRDRVVDLLRISSLIVVVAGHSIMLTVDGPLGEGANAHFDLGNLLADYPALQPLTWLLQVLPLFFFAGAAAATYGFIGRAADPKGARPALGPWLFRRSQRLLRPVAWYLLAVGALLGGVRAAATESIFVTALADVVARLGVQLLWFLGAYLLVLALVPYLQRLRTARQVLWALLGCWTATAVIDAVRLNGSGPGELGYLNFLTVWTLPAILGVAYARGLLTRTVAAALACGAVVVNLVLVAVGPYEMSLVTVPGQVVSNMTPPSLLLAGHTIALGAAAIWARPYLARLVAGPRIWWWVVFGNRGAMTLYLWHMPTLLVVMLVSAGLGLDRTGSSAGGNGVIVVAQTVILLLAMIPVILLLGRLENAPLPWWDDATGLRGTAARNVLTAAALVLTAIAILMLARYGVVGVGVWWLLAAVGGAVGARLLAPR